METSFLDSFVNVVAAHTAYDVLQSVVAKLRGKVSPDALALVEREVSQALDWVEDADQHLPTAIDETLVDCQRALRARHASEIVH
jgi:hypothetical protein